MDELDRKILEADGPGIHGWMVNGAVQVLKNGLRCPDKVMASTREYQESEDALTAFIEQRCFQNPHMFAVTGRFRQAYLQFCKESGAEPLNATTLTLKLQREHKVTKGKKRINGKDTRVYFGIELEDAPDA